MFEVVVVVEPVKVVDVVVVELVKDILVLTVVVAVDLVMDILVLEFVDVSWLSSSLLRWLMYSRLLMCSSSLM